MLTKEVGFRVLRLGPKDADQYRRIRLEALRAHPDAFSAAWADEEHQPAEAVARLLAADVVLGALTNGELQGIAALHVPEGEKLRHRGLLWGLYVQPGARRAGVAEALVRAVLAEASERVEEVTLGVGLHNAPALALYRRLGFAPLSLDLRALRLGNTYVDEVVMSRRVGAPERS